MNKIDILADGHQPLRQSLRQISPFTNDELQLLAEGLIPRDLDKRDYFVRADQPSRSVAYIVSGSVRYFYLKDGVETTSYFCLDGDWMGAYTSFLRQSPSLFYIEALEPTQLLTFDYAQLQQWERNPDFAYRINHFFRRLAEYLIGCYDDRVASFVLQSPEERYLTLFQQRPGLFQRIPQQYIANYLGVTPVSLSRIRKRIHQ